MRSCNAQFEPSYVLDRLGVKLLEPSPGDTGWEIFVLDYKIDAPIAAVVSQYSSFVIEIFISNIFISILVS